MWRGGFEGRMRTTGSGERAKGKRRECMRVEHDLHVHTYLSACCSDKERQRPRGILSSAEEMGVRVIGFADHVWMNPDETPSNWYRPQDESQITRLREELIGIQSGVRVLVGCEADTVSPGRFSITREFAEGLDFVLLACSHLHMKGFVAQPRSYGARDLAEHLLAMFASAVTSGLATSIAHPMLPCGHLEGFDGAMGAMSEGELADAFGLAAEMGVAVEVTIGFLPGEGGSFRWRRRCGCFRRRSGRDADLLSARTPTSRRVREDCPS